MPIEICLIINMNFLLKTALATTSHKYIVLEGDQLKTDLLKAALSIREQVYLKYGFIEEGHEDKFHEHSIYYVLVSKADPTTPLVLARTTPGDERGMLPIEREGVQLWEPFQAEIARQRNAKPGAILELGSFVKNQEKRASKTAPLILLNYIAEDSRKKGATVLIMAVGRSILPRYKEILGDKLTVIGDECSYPGEPVTPCMFKLNEHMKG